MDRNTQRIDYILDPNSYIFVPWQKSACENDKKHARCQILATNVKSEAVVPRDINSNRFEVKHHLLI
jgi:hypothetical protein